jgi:hypothetical protein
MPARKVFQRLIPSQRIYLGYIRIKAGFGRLITVVDSTVVF